MGYAAAAGAAAGGLGSLIQGIAGLFQQGRQPPRFRQVPPPAYEVALQKYLSSILARNATTQPMSFGQWQAAGGTQPALPLVNPGMTPNEARNLGLVGPQGQQIPYVDPSQQSLTPDQQLYLGYQRSQAGGHGPLARAYQMNERLRRMEQRPQTAGRTARESRIRSRRDVLLSRGQARNDASSRLY